MKNCMRALAVGLFLLAFTLFTSCKKQSQNPEVTAEFQQVAAKYNLKLVSGLPSNSSYHFADAKSLDQFLSSHFKHSTDSLNYGVSTNSIASSIPINNRKLAAAEGDGAGGDGNLIIGSLGAASHLKFYFPVFDSHEFPSTVTLDWITGQTTAQSHFIILRALFLVRGVIRKI